MPPLFAPPSPTVSIRPFVPDDAKALYALVSAQGHDLDAFAWRGRIQSEADEAAFLSWAQSAEAGGAAFNRAVLVDGRLAGCASLYAPHAASFPDGAPTWQMGYWIGRDFRGAGASWRGMRQLIDEIEPSLPPGSTVGSRTRSRNGASRACAAKLGLETASSGLPSEFDPDDTDVVLVGPMRRPSPIRKLGSP